MLQWLSADPELLSSCHLLVPGACANNSVPRTQSGLEKARRCHVDTVGVQAFSFVPSTTDRCGQPQNRARERAVKPLNCIRRPRRARLCSQSNNPWASAQYRLVHDKPLHSIFISLSNAVALHSPPVCGALLRETLVQLSISHPHQQCIILLTAFVRCARPQFSTTKRLTEVSRCWLPVASHEAVNSSAAS